ncbi:MAG: HAD hydrolase-like protein [Pseudomonadota bacterium]
MMTQTKPPIALFDLDGTLAETGPDLRAALNHAVASIGIAPVSLEFLNFAVGQGGRVMLERTLTANGKEPTEDLIAALHPLFLEHYETRMPGETTFFDGVLDLIDELRAAGWATAICTNKPQSLSDKLIAKLGQTHRFDAICGGDRFDYRKPDGRHLMSTIDIAGGDPHRAIMFGDSISDIDGARSAGMPVVGVPFGYTDKPIAELKPDLVIEKWQQIDVAAIERLVSAHSVA